MCNEKKEENSQSISEIARDEKVLELGILQQSLKEKEELAENYYNQLLRLKAEFENFRKRTEKEKQTHLNWGKEEILLKQLKLLDVLEQAHKFTASSNNIESLKQGVHLIYQEFLKMVKEEGIKEIESLNKIFDPKLHDAVEQIESDEKEGMVLEVLQKGYSINNKVIRPAKVKVAKSRSKEVEKNKEDSN